MIHQSQVSIVFHCEDAKSFEKAREVYQALLDELRERLEAESEATGFDFNLNADPEPLEVIGL